MKAMEIISNVSQTITTILNASGLSVFAILCIGIFFLALAELGFLWQFLWKKRKAAKIWHVREGLCVFMVLATGLLTLIQPSHQVDIVTHMRGPLYSEYSNILCADFSDKNEDADEPREGAQAGEQMTVTADRVITQEELLSFLMSFMRLLSSIFALLTAANMLSLRASTPGEYDQRYKSLRISAIMMVTFCAIPVFVGSFPSTVSTEETYEYFFFLQNTENVTVEGITFLDKHGHELQGVQEENWKESTKGLTEEGTLAPGEKAWVQIFTKEPYDAGHISARGMYAEGDFVHTTMSCMFFLSAIYFCMMLDALFFYVKSVGVSHASPLYWVVRITTFGSLLFSMNSGTRLSILMTSVSVIIFLLLGLLTRTGKSIMYIYPKDTHSHEVRNLAGNNNDLVTRN